MDSDNETAWTLRTLRIHLQFQIDALDKQMKAVLEGRDKALQLQAAEYERRLTDLNHAHQEALRVQHTYVTQDKYESRAKSDDDARKAETARINEILDQHKTRLDKSEGRGSGLNQGWILFLGVIGLVATVLSIYAIISK